MLLWFVILIVQAMSFTWVSRARNSGSIAYHGVASVLSNSIYFVAQMFLIAHVTKPDMPLSEILTIMGLYTAGMTIGSVLMHWIALRFIETGKRKVGA